jgi:hypothetical protein
VSDLDFAVSIAIVPITCLSNEVVILDIAKSKSESWCQGIHDILQLWDESNRNVEVVSGDARKVFWDTLHRSRL